MIVLNSLKSTMILRIRQCTKIFIELKGGNNTSHPQIVEKTKKLKNLQLKNVIAIT